MIHKALKRALKSPLEGLRISKMSSVDENLRLLLSSLLIGCYGEIFLQGILFAQFNHYFQWYRDDRPFMKLVVAGLVLLTTLKTCQSFAMLWIEFIETFADPGPAFINFTANWTLQGNPLMVAVMGVYIRAYFCYRLLVISKTWWPSVLIATTELLALGFISVGIHLLPNLNAHNEVLLFYTLHFVFVFIGDVLLTMLTAFFLIRSRKEALPQTRGFINALVWMTFQTALPGAIFSLISLVFSQLTVTGFQLLSAFNEVTPQLYAVSMMWTLNARYQLRGLHNRSRGPSVSATASSRPQAGTKKGAESIPHNDVEVQLRSFDGVKVRTETVTQTSNAFLPPFNDNNSFAGKDTTSLKYDDVQVSHWQ